MREEADVDTFVNDFLSLGEAIDLLSTSHDELNEQMKVSDKRLYCYASTEQHANEEIKKLQEIIKNYQKMLLDYEKVKEENRKLKSSLEDYKDQYKRLDQEFQTTKEKSIQHVEELQEQHKREVFRVQQQANDLASNEISIYEDRLVNLTKEMAQCQNTMEEKETKHHADITKVKLEYDTKIQRLQQRQLARANTSSGTISARNDIFRKKLQHLQVESEKELKSLKNKCTEQLQQITDQQHQMKLQNKKFQEQSRQHQDQVRQQDKVIRQSQLEIRQSQTNVRRLQNQLEQAYEHMAMLQKTVDGIQQQEQHVVGPKRKKSMFNPNNNRLGGPLA